MPPIVLASTSRYRRELLERLRVPFTTEAPMVDESSWQTSGLSARDIARQLALEKARSVQDHHPDAIVIGSDQVVSFENEVLGKPGSESAAVAQLARMSGKTHELITAVVLLHEENALAHTDVTRLTLERLPEEALRRYVHVDRPVDCAGSYKIESLGIALFRKIESEDFTAIQGLPLMSVARMLRELGVAVP